MALELDGMYLHPYKKEWPDEYRREVKLILAVYKGSIALHHIGSTAIEGLYAKDCIDILGVVSDLSAVRASLDELENIGYQHKGSHGIEGREYFSKSKRKVHLHIFKEGNSSIDKHIGFVQILRSTPSLVTKLNELKQELYDKYPYDKESYQKEKVFFYNEIHTML